MLPSMKFYSNKSSGLSLLEVMLSLLVIAGILFAVLRYAGPARQQTQAMKFVEQLNTIADASNRWAEQNPSFKGVDVTKLAKAGLLPSRYITDPAALTNPWRNQITVSQNGDNINQLAISSSVPNADVCQRIKNRVLRFAPSTTCKNNQLTVIIGSKN